MVVSNQWWVDRASAAYAAKERIPVADTARQDEHTPP
jgi:hypothetical protein